MFSEDQKRDLAAPLLLSNVLKRELGGRKVSYLESWHVIAEANRIFGFDGWSRETVEIRCVSEREREIGQAKNPGWGVSYISKVRVVAFAGDTIVTREGCGAGHGIDRDLGQAHESAIKEAESDAAKRALMTFGNSFGLALYDKAQEAVLDDTKSAPPPRQNAPSTPITAQSGTKEGAGKAPASDAPKMTPQEWTLAQLSFIRAGNWTDIKAWEIRTKLAMEKLRQSNEDLWQDILDTKKARIDAIQTP